MFIIEASIIAAATVICAGLKTARELGRDPFLLVLVKRRDVALAYYERFASSHAKIPGLKATAVYWEGRLEQADWDLMEYMRTRTSQDWGAGPSPESLPEKTPDWGTWPSDLGDTERTMRDDTSKG